MGEPHQGQVSALRAGYNWKVRAFELVSILGYAAVMVRLSARLLPSAAKAPWLAAAACLLGYLAADFVSGVVHWSADTWGTPAWPVVGAALIRPFREHHLDPLEITRHDFIETNGNNCFISLPVGALALLLQQGPGRPGALFLGTFVFSLILWVLLTNQFHKWAHLPKPPPPISWLQRAGLILSPSHHAVHHTAPFAAHYCITTGWLNEPLARLRFFRGLERLITAATGLLPRADDLGEQKALAVFEAEVAPLSVPEARPSGPAPALPRP